MSYVNKGYVSTSISHLTFGFGVRQVLIVRWGARKRKILQGRKDENNVKEMYRAQANEGVRKCACQRFMQEV